MREVLEKKPILTKEEARSLIERCMKILYYRDARSFNRVSVVLRCALPGELRCASGWRSRGQSPQLTAAFAVVQPLILSKPHGNAWVGRDEAHWEICKQTCALQSESHLISSLRRAVLSWVLLLSGWPGCCCFSHHHSISIWRLQSFSFVTVSTS